MAKGSLRAGALLAGVAAALGLAAAVAQAADAPAPSPSLPPLKAVPGSLLLPTVRPQTPLRDTCGAAALANLVGRPRTQIPVAVDLTRRRVACTACPVAPDIRLDRVNILYDAQTGRVAKITCG